jgi:hypothetical protein
MPEFHETPLMIFCISLNLVGLILATRARARSLFENKAHASVRRLSVKPEHGTWKALRDSDGGQSWGDEIRSNGWDRERKVQSPFIAEVGDIFPQ